ncbi:ATP-binding protein [Cyclobacterium sp.]|uniref:ATP-binding protein n=1 Tax=Cyclobacterium sp. TaxID=1966343 RepID=UPI001988C137|nr:ATP-binding protein [Cyclobacterium sp.]MBD3627790.1 hypothetical protein [Cyclobacterium sp.]
MEIPIPEDEFDRLLQLADYDLDNSELENSLKDLTKLAGKVAGTNISLVKHLVDNMGGSLKIDSKLGEYARFEVRLPV